MYLFTLFADGTSSDGVTSNAITTALVLLVVSLISQVGTIVKVFVDNFTTKLMIKENTEKTEQTQKSVNGNLDEQIKLARKAALEEGRQAGLKEAEDKHLLKP